MVSLCGDHWIWYTSSLWPSNECSLAFMLRISHRLTTLSAAPVATKYSLNGLNATQLTSAACAYTVVAGVS